MRVQISDPRQLGDLAEFLAVKLDAVHARVGPDELEVSPLGSLNAVAAARALDRELDVWAAGHPGVTARRRRRRRSP